MPQRVDFGAAAEYGVSMEVPKLYRISAEVERDQKARFRVLSKKFGRTMRAQLTYMVSEAIAEVELPKDEASPRVGYVAPVQRYTAEAAQQKFMGLLWEPHFMWIPAAIDEVRRLCAEGGVTDWQPKLPSQGWLDTKYRPRAKAAGRDVDADIAAANMSEDRL